MYKELPQSTHLFSRPEMAKTPLQGGTPHRLSRKDTVSACEGTGLHFPLYKITLRK